MTRSIFPGPTRPRRPHAWLIAMCSALAACALLAVGLAVAAPGAHSSGVRTTTSAAAMPAAGSRAADRSVGKAAQPAMGIDTFVSPGGIGTVRDLPFASAPDGSAVTLDVCTPVTRGTHRPAVLAIHGGGWIKGDKGTPGNRAVCQWLASEGFVAFEADYTLGKQGMFPVQPEELRKAISWIREPATVTRYGLDPKRLALFGGSAGGNLAALLATEGSGPTDNGSRVAALVDLSGPVDLTAYGQTLGHPGAALQAMELAYLGCTTFTDCSHATEASPIAHVDSSDPPTFIQASKNDFVPQEQGEAFASALTKVGVPAKLRLVPGDRHSIALLDAPSRAAIAAFLHRYLD